MTKVLEPAEEALSITRHSKSVRSYRLMVRVHQIVGPAEVPFQPFDRRYFSPQVSSMSEPWANIIAIFGQKRTLGDETFRSAIAGVEQLAILIAEGPLNRSLFGWTSMHDLCVQQTDTAPYAGPYLRMSPLPSGMVDFRYIDTAIADRQWQRAVPADAAPAQLVTFLDQLGWTPGIVPAVNGLTA